MEWFWDAINSVAIVSAFIWAGFGFRHLASENDERKADSRQALGQASKATSIAMEAQRDAAYARKAANSSKLPDTPANVSLVQRLREVSAAAQKARAAHPAGKTYRPPVRRSATTGRYVTSNPVQTTDSGIGYIPVAAAIALTTDTSSSYSDNSSSSSSSYDGGSSYSSSDSGSFGGGDSGSF